jgi:hypothetical protein
MTPGGALRFFADATLVVHLGFVLFVMLGGVLVLRWRRLAWVHVPAVAWGVLIGYAGWICPLTPLENYLRERSGLSQYSGDFIEHYVLQLLYPLHLTRIDQVFLGSIVLAVNGLVYWRLLRAAGSTSSRPQ